MIDYWSVVLFYSVLTLFRVIQRRIKSQTIQFSISVVFVYKRLNVKTVLFQTNHFGISIQFQCQKLSYSKQFSLAKVQTVLFQTVQFGIIQCGSIRPIDGTQSGATTPDERGPGSDDNEGVLLIPQSSSINRTSPSDCFESYPGHLLGGGYSSAEKQSMHSTAPEN